VILPHSIGGTFHTHLLQPSTSALERNCCTADLDLPIRSSSHYHGKTPPPKSPFGFDHFQAKFPSNLEDSFSCQRIPPLSWRPGRTSPSLASFDEALKVDDPPFVGLSTPSSLPAGLWALNTPPLLCSFLLMLSLRLPEVYADLPQIQSQMFLVPTLKMGGKSIRPTLSAGFSVISCAPGFISFPPPIKFLSISLGWLFPTFPLYLLIHEFSLNL